MYQEFAEVYDVLTEDVNYDENLKYIEKIFEKHLAFKPHLLAELACGTGSMTKRFSENGYDVIGIDMAQDMLNVAREKCDESVLLLNQDMTEFELFGTVDAIVCLLDSVNYVESKDKLLKMFKLVENYLEFGGVFVFDINSAHKLRNVLAENTFVRETEHVLSVWENEQDENCVHFYLNFFVENEDGTYNRFSEEHTEYVYGVEEIKNLLEQAGLINITCYAENSFTHPDEKTERIFFVANKKGKKLEI